MRLLFFMAALLLAGCAAPQLLESEREPIHLRLGLMPVVTWDSQLGPGDSSSDDFVASLKGVGVFDAVSVASSHHSEADDLVVALDAAGFNGRMTMRVYEGATGVLLKTLPLEAHLKWEGADDLAVKIVKALVSGFGPRTEEYKRLIAGRKAPAREESSAQAEKAQVHSDIDHPAYSVPERPDDFALVIGVEKYSDLPDARYAERDAQAVTDHLLAMGFPSRNVVSLSGDKAGYKSIEKYVETWLPRNVNENSRLFFYFSGHGAPDLKNGRAYLLPWDGDPSFLETTGYPIQRLYEKLGALKAKEIVVALDACFSGAGGRSVLAKGARPLVTKVADVAVPRNLTVFAAASGEQITSTLEDQGHGTFTYYFLKGLSGAAKDPSGRVTTQALYGYLKPKVQDAARRQNREQEPVLHTQGDWELVQFR